MVNPPAKPENPSNPEPSKQPTPAPVEDRFKDYSKEELLKVLLDKDSQLKETVTESMKRKQKIRDMESATNDAEQTRLQEQGKIQEAFDLHKEKTKEFDTLKSYYEKDVATKEAKVQELESKISGDLAAEYGLIKDSLPVETKLEYLTKKLNTGADIRIDSTKGGGGTSSGSPKTFKELTTMSVEDQRRIKKDQPNLYADLLKNINRS